MRPASEEKSSSRVAPFGRGRRREGVALDRGDDVGVDLRRFAGHAEGAVAAVAPGAAGDLADLLGDAASACAGRRTCASPAKATWSTSMLRPMPIASVATRKSTSPDWKSSTCALRVRGRQRPHHHRRAAALAADQFGDGVDGLGGEGDDGAAPRQPGELLRPGVGQLREAVARLDVGVGAQAADQRRRPSPRPAASSRRCRARAAGGG